MDKFCIDCGVEIPKGSQFCINCGMPLAENPVKSQEPIQTENMDKFCIDCGAEIPKGSRFCVNCGTKFEDKVKPVKKEEITKLPQTQNAKKIQASFVKPLRAKRNIKLTGNRGFNSKIMGSIVIFVVVIIAILMIFYLFSDDLNQKSITTNGNNDFINDEEYHGTIESKTFAYNTKIFADYSKIEISDLSIELWVRCPGINDGWSKSYDGFASDKIPDRSILKSAYDDCEYERNVPECREKIYVDYRFSYPIKNILSGTIEDGDFFDVSLTEIRFYDKDDNFLWGGYPHMYYALGRIDPRETVEEYFIVRYDVWDDSSTHLKNKKFYDFDHCEIDIEITNWQRPIWEEWRSQENNDEVNEDKGEYKTFEYDTKIYTEYDKFEITDFNIYTIMGCPEFIGFAHYDGFATDKIPDKDVLKKAYDDCDYEWNVPECREKIGVYYWFVFTFKNTNDEETISLWVNEIRFYDKDDNFLWKGSSYMSYSTGYIGPGQSVEKTASAKYDIWDDVGSWEKNRYFYDADHCEIDIEVDYFGIPN